jgi:four helix bundle protein
MADFRKLRVWRSAHALVISTERAARKIRRKDFLSLRSQMIRAAMSIAANIVEGRAQATDREFCRFLRYALASARELESAAPTDTPSLG